MRFKILRESSEEKAQRGQYPLTVGLGLGLGCYMLRLYNNQLIVCSLKAPIVYFLSGMCAKHYIFLHALNALHLKSDR